MVHVGRGDHDTASRTRAEDLTLIKGFGLRTSYRARVSWRLLGHLVNHLAGVLVVIGDVDARGQVRSRRQIVLGARSRGIHDRLVRRLGLWWRSVVLLSMSSVLGREEETTDRWWVLLI